MNQRNTITMPLLRSPEYVMPINGLSQLSGADPVVSLGLTFKFNEKLEPTTTFCILQMGDTRWQILFDMLSQTGGKAQQRYGCADRSISYSHQQYSPRHSNKAL
jgi:hypothetical protein